MNQNTNKVIINTFDGGHAEDVRTFSTNQCQESNKFDIFSNPHTLRPYSDQVAETISTGSAIMTDFQITDVVPMSISNAIKLVGLGRESAASGKLSFFTKDSPITSSWAKIATVPNSETPQPGTLVEYKGQAYAVGNTSTAKLYQFTSGTSITEIGTLGSVRDTTTPKPFVHPEDNILYIGVNNTIYTYNESSLVLGLTLPSNVKITSLTSFGGYLAVACKKVSYDNQFNALDAGRSVVYLWGRDVSLSTLQQIVDWGDGSLEVLENINETLVGVSAVKTVGTYDTITNYNYKVKIYSGGVPQIVKDFNVSNTNVLRPWKAKQYDKLYFGFDTDNNIHVCGKNKNGQWFVTKDKPITTTGSFITGTLNGFSIIGDILFTSYTDGGIAGYFTRTSDSTFTSQSVYLTTINPKMPTEDRYEEKRLVSVQIAYQLNSSSGIAGLGYYCEDRAGTSRGTLQEVISETKTVAGDYIFTANSHTDGTAFLTGREYQFRTFSTGDVRIKEIKYKYEKVNTI
jgi:hypothetical protein